MSSAVSSELPLQLSPISSHEHHHQQQHQVHGCPQCLELFGSENAVLCHRLLRMHWPARFLYHVCIWPGCSFKAFYRYQIRCHIRRLHYGHGMPRTLIEMILSAEAVRVCSTRVRLFTAPDDFIISSSFGGSGQIIVKPLL